MNDRVQSDNATNWNEVNVVIEIPKGTVADNVIIKPMISLFDNTPYTPYVADLTGVEVARYGKNLLLATDFYQKQQNYSQLVEDDRNCVRFTDSSPLKYYGLTFEEKTQYTVSFWCKTVTRENTSGDATSRFFVFYYTDGTKSLLTQKATKGEWVSVSLTSTANKTISYIGMDSVSFMNWLYVDIDTFQLEKGTGTEYEPYTETIYTANADGTVEGVKSISPNMTLIPNNNAVTVECEYLRDIDLYIDNLITNVALTGGM